MQPDQVETLRDLLVWIKQEETRIYVRCRCDGGEYRNVRLSDCPPEQWAACVHMWLERGQVPSAVVEN